MSDFPRGGSSRVGNFFAGGIKKWFIGGLVAVMGVTALMGIYTVDEREVAVIDKFGAIERVETEPGLHFKTPWIEGATFYDKALQSFETEPMTIKTEDGQELQDVRLKVQWKIQPDQVEYYRSELQDPEGRLTSLVEAVAKGEIGKVNTTDIALERSSTESAIKEALAARAASLYNLDVTNVELANFEFTQEYARQIEENMQAKAAVERAKQDAERANFEKQRDITKAQGAKESAILTAQGAAEATRLAADAEAHSIREKGSAEADAIRDRAEALGDNPLLVELEKAQRWQGGVPTTVVGGDDATPIINLDNGNGGKVTPVPGQ